MPTSTTKSIINVQTSVNAPVEKVWKHWITPASIIRWNHASDDWHTTTAENDLRTGGKFSYRMEAKDGSMGFDFWGIYDNIVVNQQIDSSLGDGRKVSVTFKPAGNKTEIIESFEAEKSNPEALQRGGWQSILDNFKKFTESTT